MTKILIDEALVRQALEALDYYAEPDGFDLNTANHAAEELRQALSEAALDALLDKMAENAKELGLDYMEGSAEQYEKVLEQPAQQEPVVLDPKDVKIETLCTQRGGGFLSVMTSGVRLTHAPTGITVEETSDRSPHRNKAAAWERLTQLVAAPPAPAPDPDELTIAYLNGIDTGKKRKPWAGLTDEECVEAIDESFAFGLDNGNVSDKVVICYARTIEAKLKEKNT